MPGTAEDASDAVVETVAHDVDGGTLGRTHLEQPRQPSIDADLVQQIVDLLPCRRDERHLAGQTLARSDPAGHPRFFELPPPGIRERFEDGVRDIARRDGAIEVEEHDEARWRGPSSHATTGPA